MKKAEIKKAVNQKAEARLPKAIKEEAEYRARAQVRQAMYDEPDDTPASEAKEHGAPDNGYPSRGERSGRTVVSPTDPRICGSK